MDGALASLKSFARPAPVERCGLCGASVPDSHPHLFDNRRRAMECACAACALLFARREGGPFRSVPWVAEPWPDFRLDDARWDALAVPIGLAFFTRSSAANRVVAYYPSPAGAVESQLPLETWAALERDNPALARLAPDVEALLVHRMGGARQYWRVSIDECFALVGLVRRSWRGFTGGAAMREALDAFFARLGQGGARG
jgi:hypothetical protein